MSNNLLWFIGAFVAFDVIMMFVIVPMILRNAWTSIATGHPAVNPADDAVRRSFQSFRIGVVNLGGSVHVAVDEHFLHLSPARFWQWFGLNPTSIPWDAVHLRTCRKRSATATINGKSIAGPAWCLGIAHTTDPEAS